VDGRLRGPRRVRAGLGGGTAERTGAGRPGSGGVRARVDGLRQTWGEPDGDGRACGGAGTDGYGLGESAWACREPTGGGAWAKAGTSHTRTVSNGGIRVDASIMSLGVHGGGIHIVWSRGLHGGGFITGHGSVVGSRGC
jgi:hypothetical protein